MIKHKESIKFWDGSESLPFTFHDGGREDSGFKGFAGDCVTRSIAIVSGKSYKQIYKDLAEINKKTHGKKTAREGINTKCKAFKDYMISLGFEWHPLMGRGTGCQYHLVKGELPEGDLVISVSKHYTALIDGVIYDTHDPQRQNLVHDDKGKRIAHRCAYGYWKFNGNYRLTEPNNAI